MAFANYNILTTFMQPAQPHQKSQRKVMAPYVTTWYPDKASEGKTRADSI